MPEEAWSRYPAHASCKTTRIWESFKNQGTKMSILSDEDLMVLKYRFGNERYIKKNGWYSGVKTAVLKIKTIRKAERTNNNTFLKKREKLGKKRKKTVKKWKWSGKWRNSAVRQKKVMSVLHVFVKISHFSCPNNVTMHLTETETKTWGGGGGVVRFTGTMFFEIVVPFFQ